MSAIPVETLTDPWRNKIERSSGIDVQVHVSKIRIVEWREEKPSSKV